MLNRSLAIAAALAAVSAHAAGHPSVWSDPAPRPERVTGVSRADRRAMERSAAKRARRAARNLRNAARGA